MWMHDLLQDMARKIIHEECPEVPGKRNILWLFEDINNVLTNNTVRDFIKKNLSTYPIILLMFNLE